MKRLLTVSSRFSEWTTRLSAGVRFLLFVALLLLPGSVILLPLLGWIRHKAAHTREARA